MENEQNENENEGDFDFKAALSGRDKKITSQDDLIKSQKEEIELMKNQLAGIKPNGEVPPAIIPLDSNSEPEKKELSLDSLMNQINNLENRLKTESEINEKYRQNSTNQMMGVKSRFNDPDFVAWADGMQLSEYLPDGGTVGSQYLDFLKKGNTEGMQKITDAYDRTLGLNAATPNFNPSLSPIDASKAKKDKAKAKELISKAEAAMKSFNYNDAKKFRSEAEEILKEM